MIRWLIVLVALFLAACTPPPTPEQSVQTASPPSTPPDLGPAPELVGDVWLNAAAPLRLADLRGQVVLVDMWTFG